MGSFSSTARVPRADDLDEDLDFTTTTRGELLGGCEEELEDLPPPFERKFSKTFPQHTSDGNDGKAIQIYIYMNIYVLCRYRQGQRNNPGIPVESTFPE